MRPPGRRPAGTRAVTRAAPARAGQRRARARPRAGARPAARGESGAGGQAEGFGRSSGVSFWFCFRVRASTGGRRLGGGPGRFGQGGQLGHQGAFLPQGWWVAIPVGGRRSGTAPSCPAAWAPTRRRAQSPTQSHAIRPRRPAGSTRGRRREPGRARGRRGRRPDAGALAAPGPGGPGRAAGGAEGERGRDAGGRKGERRGRTARVGGRSGPCSRRHRGARAFAGGPGRAGRAQPAGGLRPGAGRPAGAPRGDRRAPGGRAGARRRGREALGAAGRGAPGPAPAAVPVGAPRPLPVPPTSFVGRERRGGRRAGSWLGPDGPPGDPHRPGRDRQDPPGAGGRGRRWAEGRRGVRRPGAPGRSGPGARGGRGGAGGAGGVGTAPARGPGAGHRRGGPCCWCWTTASTWWRPAPRLAAGLLAACPALRCWRRAGSPWRWRGRRCGRCRRWACRTPPRTAPWRPPGRPSGWRRGWPARSGAPLRRTRRAAAPGFALAAENAGAVAEVCRRLDGLPLAIGAGRRRGCGGWGWPGWPPAWTPAWTCSLPGAGEGRPAQQTLRATLDWSYDLLEPAEQALLARLSVFAGGFDLAAAGRWPPAPGRRGGGAGDGACPAGAAGRPLAGGGGPGDGGRGRGRRYRLLETVREYAAERLADEGHATARGGAPGPRRALAALAERAEASAPDRSGRPLRSAAGSSRGTAAHGPRSRFALDARDRGRAGAPDGPGCARSPCTSHHLRRGLEARDSSPREGQALRSSRPSQADLTADLAASRRADLAARPGRSGSEPRPAGPRPTFWLGLPLIRSEAPAAAGRAWGRALARLPGRGGAPISTSASPSRTSATDPDRRTTQRGARLTEGPVRLLRRRTHKGRRYNFDLQNIADEHDDAARRRGRLSQQRPAPQQTTPRCWPFPRWASSAPALHRRTKLRRTLDDPVQRRPWGEKAHSQQAFSQITLPGLGGLSASRRRRRADGAAFTESLALPAAHRARPGQKQGTRRGSAARHPRQRQPSGALRRPQWGLQRRGTGPRHAAEGAGHDSLRREPRRPRKRPATAHTPPTSDLDADGPWPAA